MTVQTISFAAAEKRLASSSILSDQQHRHLGSCQSRVIARTVKALTASGAPITVEFWVDWGNDASPAFARVWE